MPYIRHEVRDALDAGRYNPRSAGELTYTIYRDALTLLGRAPTFSDYAEVIGAIEAAKMEIYRRLVAPYEDKKIKEHGDI